MLSTLIHYALHKSIEKKYNIITAIIGHLPIDFNRSYNGETPLQCAIKNDNRYFLHCVTGAGYHSPLPEINPAAINFTPQTINVNTIIQQGHFAGVPIVFWLIDVLRARGIEILAADNNALGLTMTTQTINALVMKEGGLNEIALFRPQLLPILAAHKEASMVKLILPLFAASLRGQKESEKVSVRSLPRELIWQVAMTIGIKRSYVNYLKG